MRLLFAEDERSLSRAVTVLLEKNGYSVDAVYDGAEALDWLETGNYDGVILDVMMPKADGFEVLRRMRARGDTTPVLMLTARSEVDDRCWDWTAARTTTSRNPSPPRSFWPGSGP